MTIALFILVLVVLILVHEFGHLVAAKLFRMRVDEFGVGYPPRAATLFKSGGTAYTLNWLPFGGFVKIHGEDGSETPSPDSFVAKPRYQQAIVLVAGIVMNLLLAWVLLSVTLGLGTSRVLSDAEALTVPDARIVISRVLPESPAAQAGIEMGDTVLGAQAGERSFEGGSASAFTDFVASAEEGVGISILRDGETMIVSAQPQAGVIPADPERVALGVGVASVSSAPVPWYEAPIEGAKLTYDATIMIAVGLTQFFASVFTLTADLSQIAGPVGIAGAVGDASATGIVALLSLMAVISINLALINLLPIPALDGGRLLFVIVESIVRRPIPASVSGFVNAAGFLFLILLMVVITASDIFKLVS